LHFSLLLYDREKERAVGAFNLTLVIECLKVLLQLKINFSFFFVNLDDLDFKLKKEVNLLIIDLKKQENVTG
jgi:hypothetical protein